MKAEELFLKKYSNKLSAVDSWVIRFADEYAKIVAEKAFEAGRELGTFECGESMETLNYSDFTQWLNQYLKEK